MDPHATVADLPGDGRAGGITGAMPPRQPDRSRPSGSAEAGPARPPTLEEVAVVAGVSRATVSRVINAVPTVDPRIREVVQRAIVETGYVPNLAARSLVTRRTDSVALVISEPPDAPARARRRSSTGCSPTRTSAGSPRAPRRCCVRRASTW